MGQFSRQEASSNFADLWLEDRVVSADAHVKLLWPQFLDLDFTQLSILPTEAANYCRNRRVLDVGCGDGSFLAIVAEHGYHNLTGFDVNETLIKAASLKLPHVEFTVADAAKRWPFEDRSIDVVVASNVAMHLTDQELSAFFTEAYRTLAADGHLYLAVVNFDWAASRYSLQTMHEKLFLRPASSNKLRVDEYVRPAEYIVELAEQQGLASFPVGHGQDVRIEMSEHLSVAQQENVGRKLFTWFLFHKPSELKVFRNPQVLNEQGG